MAKHEYKFIVETLEASQRRKYGDSYYHYEVESKSGLHVIEQFCKKVLEPAIPEEQYRKEDAGFCDNHFRSYYTEYTVLKKVPFMEEGVNKVVYKVVSPSTH